MRETICMKCQFLFSVKNINVASTELVQRLVKFNISFTMRNTRICKNRESRSAKALNSRSSFIYVYVYVYVPICI